MTTWNLVTPLGTIVCKKSRSFGEKVWRKPATKMYKPRYFDDRNKELSRDTFAKVGNEWVPARGNDEYAKRMYYKQWVADGKPKKYDGRKLGIVAKKIGAPGARKSSGEASMTWNARESAVISKIELRRFVSRDMKYIIPMPESVPLYRKVVQELSSKGKVLIAKNIQISKNSNVWYDYAILSVGGYLVYVELLPNELAKPFPPDALMPTDNQEEVGSIDETNEELI